MANYTITLKELLEWKCKNPQGDVEVSRLFPSSYELFDPEYKDTLEGKIVAHFYLREIGQETPDAFLYYFRTAFLEALPRYNIRAKAMKRDFFEELDKNHVVHEETHSDGTGETNSSGDTVSRDTPYTGLDANSPYASNSGTSASHADNANEANSTRDFYERTASQIDNARRLADLFVDADRELLDALDTCFMQIF